MSNSIPAKCRWALRFVKQVLTSVSLVGCDFQALIVSKLGVYLEAWNEIIFAFDFLSGKYMISSFCSDFEIRGVHNFLKPIQMTPEYMAISAWVLKFKIL
jgi:hypothetical protein